MLAYEEGNVETSKLYFDKASRRGGEVRGSCGERSCVGGAVLPIEFGCGGGEAE